MWIVVDYTTVFIFRLLMFVDNGLDAGMGLDLGWQQRCKRYYGRIVVLSILVPLLNPFLLAWTIIGNMWFTRSKNYLPEDGQKWGFRIWLLFRYCGLLCIACISLGKWVTRRQAHLLRAQQGIPVSEYGVRGLPCAHNFHVECIDEWLRLNVKCPRCRCSVFPILDLSAFSNIHTHTDTATATHTETERPSTRNDTSNTNIVVNSGQYVRNQSPSQSYLLRLHGFLQPENSAEHVRVVVEEPSR